MLYYLLEDFLKFETIPQPSSAEDVTWNEQTLNLINLYISHL